MTWVNPTSLYSGKPNAFLVSTQQKAGDMTTDLKATKAGGPATILLFTPAVRDAVAGPERDLTEFQLREALARADDLLRERDTLIRKLLAWQETAANLIMGLTPRQRQVMELVLTGLPSKAIAAEMGVSQRTVENHRAAIMKKTGSKSLPALLRLALAATWSDAEDLSP